MISNNTDREWEKFGRTEPYFGVLSDESFKMGNLTPERLDEFFASGEAHVAAMFAAVEARFGENFRPESALDFGCGVGRLVIPLAGRCRSVVGIDVSPSMIREARENCGKRGVANVEFFGSLDEIPAGRRFGFVHSYIVLQHIDPSRGLEIFKRLTGLLAPGGVAAIQMTFSIRTSGLRAMLGVLRRRVHALNMLINLTRGQPPGTPYMQMNPYDMNAVLSHLYDVGCQDVGLHFTNHGGCLGAILVFRKP